jgi:hypothetical protein
VGTHGRLKQEDHEFKASLGYIMNLCLKKKKKRLKSEIVQCWEKGWREDVRK